MPFYDIIKNTIFEDQTTTDEQTFKIIELTIEIYEVLARELLTVDFWNDQIAQKKLKRQINDFIKSSKLISISKMKLKDELIEKIFNLAKHLDKKLIY